MALDKTYKREILSPEHGIYHPHPSSVGIPQFPHSQDGRQARVMRYPFKAHGINAIPLARNQAAKL